MTDIKDKFPEFRALENNELELVLKLYEDHLGIPFSIANPSYYVSGALVLLVSFMFVNAQRLQTPRTELLGLSETEAEVQLTAHAAYNAPQKVIMITILASSVSGLGYISLRSFFNGIGHGNNYGCFYISNAMLSGAVSIAAACDSIDVWHAVVISFVGCLLYSVGSKLLIKFELDDPLEAFLVYGVQGLWGTVAAGLFDRNVGLLNTGDGR